MLVDKFIFHIHIWINKLEKSEHLKLKFTSENCDYWGNTEYLYEYVNITTSQKWIHVAQIIQIITLYMYISTQDQIIKK